MSLSRAVFRHTFSYFLLLPLVFLTSPEPSANAKADRLIIAEVQIAGEKSTDDFVKIFNPTEADVWLNDHDGSYVRLVKRTQAGKKDYTLKSWSKETLKIPAKGFYFWANKNYLAFSEPGSRTSQSLSEDNSLALRLGPENTGEIIDSLGWGNSNNSLFEARPFPKNPEANQGLKRKIVDNLYQDTDDNKEDFILTEVIVPAKDGLSAPAGIANKPIGAVETAQNNPGQGIANKVFFNEILPAPAGPDAEEEWVELTNLENNPIDVSGWQIKDGVGTISTYLIPENTYLKPRGFLVFYRPQTKITLNNTKDRLFLYNASGALVDSILYESAKKGESFARTDSGWLWTSSPSLGKENIIASKNTFDSKGLSNKPFFPQEIMPASASWPAKTGLPLNFKIFAAGLSAAFLSSLFVFFLKKRVLKIALSKN